MHALYRVTLTVHGAKGRDVPKPLRYPRPFERKAKAPAATRAEILAKIPRR